MLRPLSCMTSKHLGINPAFGTGLHTTDRLTSSCMGCGLVGRVTIAAINYLYQSDKLFR